MALKNSSSGSSNSIFNKLLQYDNFIVFGGFGFVILGSILITVLYEQSYNMRHNVLFNNTLAIVCGFSFIYLIFKFMGQQVKILQFEIDLGLLLFLTLGIFVVFVLGD